MVKLKELISYWEDRLLPHPPVTGIPWHEVLTSTIAYLQELEKMKGEKNEP